MPMAGSKLLLCEEDAGEIRMCSIPAKLAEVTQTKGEPVFQKMICYLKRQGLREISLSQWAGPIVLPSFSRQPSIDIILFLPRSPRPQTTHGDHQKMF